MPCWSISAARCAASASPMGEAMRLFECGMQIPHSIYLMDTRGEMMNPFGRGFGDGDPDGTAWPIPGTLSPVWGEPRAQILMTLRDDAGVPDPAEPRAALERVAERFAELKLVPVAALELEFYLIDRARDAAGAPQPPHQPARRPARNIGVGLRHRRSRPLCGFSGGALRCGRGAARTGQRHQQGICAGPVRSQSQASIRCRARRPITRCSSSRS